MHDMDAEYWRKKWIANDIRFHQETVHPQLVKYGSELPTGKVMVPLCGKSNDMLWLRSKGHEVVGIELSPVACEAFFVDNGISFSRDRVSPTCEKFAGGGFAIWCGDYFAIPESAWDGCSSVYDRAALVALPPEVRRKYIDHLLRVWTSDAGALLLIALEYASDSLIGPPFSVMEKEIREKYGEAFEIVVLGETKDESLSGRPPKFQQIAVVEKTYLLRRKGSAGSS